MWLWRPLRILDVLSLCLAVVVPFWLVRLSPLTGLWWPLLTVAVGVLATECVLRAFGAPTWAIFREES